MVFSNMDTISQMLIHKARSLRSSTRMCSFVMETYVINESLLAPVVATGTEYIDNVISETVYVSYIELQSSPAYQHSAWCDSDRLGDVDELNQLF